MQRRLLITLLFVLFLARPTLAGEEPLSSILQLSNEIYRLSQEMVAHGSEGHTHEIVHQGQEMIRRTETLIKEIQSSPLPTLKEKKNALLDSLRATLKQTQEAVRLGEQGKAGPALDASRKASFRAKQSRQQLQSLR